jgi:hypothetical protein
MDLFLEAVFLMEPPLKRDLQRRSWSYMLPCAVRGGVLVEPPLIEKGDIAKKIISILVKTTFKLAGVTIYKLKQTG